jgi:hypothetical protein
MEIWNSAALVVQSRTANPTRSNSRWQVSELAASNHRLSDGGKRREMNPGILANAAFIICTPMSQLSARLIAFFFTCAIPLGAMASEFLASKSLQRITVAPEANVWRVKEDALVSPRNASYVIEHRALDGLIVVRIDDMRDSPFERTHEKYWAEYKADMRGKFRVFREVALPNGFVAPRSFGCNADESSMSSAAPLGTTVTCTASQAQNQVIVTITFANFGDAKRHVGDVNALLSTIAWR